jgi:hypothetical protein
LLPANRSARRKNATAFLLEVFLTVTSVTVSEPPRPTPGCVCAVTRTRARARLWSDLRLAYRVIVACGRPMVFFQSMTSFCVESQ